MYIKCTSLLVLILTVVGQEISEKICSTNPSGSACQQIARSYEVECNNNFHNVDCLLNIQSNKTHLGRITGEDAVLGANLLSDDVVVLAEIQSAFPLSEIVVIGKISIPNNFVNLRGRKLCHPGYAHDSAIPHFMLQEFEDKIVELERPECNDNVTLVERHLKALSVFFNDSCRPGPWTQKEKADQVFKERYRSLCNLCGDAKCSVNYREPFNDSLSCLVNNDADVAVTTSREAKFFFSEYNNEKNYKYICKNGTSSSAFAPCIWSRKLPDLLVAERKSADYMKSYLKANLNSYINSTEDNTERATNEALVSILDLQHWEQILFLEQYGSYRSLRQYVEERVAIPNPAYNKQCDRTLKWCTRSNQEQEKCRWLSQAAANRAIQPVVECIKSDGDDELSCLDDVRRQKADIVVASSDYAYISFKKGLTSIAFPETDNRNLSVILAVKRSDQDYINSFNDMRDKMACIPRFGGKEHLAFVDTIKTFNLTHDAKCDYGNVLSNFIGTSCVPGVRSSLIRESTDYVNKDKLCARCQPVNATSTAAYCNDNENNKYFGNYGAIQCLRDRQGDFAIITKIDIDNGTDLNVICKNNSVASISGLDVDSNCALAVLPNSEVVAAQYNTKIKDIKFALYEFERWFGQDLRKSFHLFDIFNGQPDLLFLDSTPGLNIDNEVENVQEYKKLLKNVKRCTIRSAAAATTPLLFLTVLALCFFFF